MSPIRQTIVRAAVQRHSIATRSITPSRVILRGYASGTPDPQPPKSQGLGGLAVAIGAVAVIVPSSLWFINRGHDGVQHNDHEAQKKLHTDLTYVEKSKYPSGRVGGTLHGIDDVVTTKQEDVESHLPHDALNHPVNREKIEKTMQLKPPTKRVDPIKSVRLPKTSSQTDDA